ncbi:MAG: hypothetical protein WCI51_03740 [Lentisphaerota bacterium]
MMKKKNSIASKSDVFTVEVSKLFQDEVLAGLDEVTKELGMSKGHIAGNALIQGINRARDIIKEHNADSNEPEWKRCNNRREEIELSIADSKSAALQYAMTPRNFEWINNALNTAMKAAGLNLSENNLAKIFLTEYCDFSKDAYLGNERDKFQIMLTKRILEDKEKLQDVFRALYYVQCHIEEYFFADNEERDSGIIPDEALKSIFESSFKEKRHQSDTFRPAILDPAGKLRERIEAQFKKSALSREAWYRKFAEAGLAVMESREAAK